MSAEDGGAGAGLKPAPTREIANKILFVFLDGVGLGVDDPAANPFVAARTPFLDELLGGDLTASLPKRLEPRFTFKHLDARLGYSGLPQSATGQTALLTGKNGAAVMNGHYGPWPGPTLKTVLDGGTLFSDMLESGGRAQLANAYPPGYFAAVAAGKQKENVPVYGAKVAGLSLQTLQDYRAGNAASVDLTGEYLQRFEPDLPLLTPFETGQHLAELATRADFTFFDFWPTDATGHRGSFAEAVALVEKLDAFLSGVVTGLDGVTLLITSDHGNLEDKTTRSHTTAPVPLLVIGPGAEFFREADSLLDVAPLIREVLGLTARRTVAAG
ncbi:metalloenzyme [soil metagenome]